jgi:hypothetical protein
MFEMKIFKARTGLADAARSPRTRSPENSAGNADQRFSRDFGNRALQRQGLPERLGANAEALSGIDVSDVRVHRNSSAPERFDALACTQGGDIHLGPGEGRQLAHELWHVVQQRQGRVPTQGFDMGGAVVNDSPALEAEADRMASRLAGPTPAAPAPARPAAGGDAAQPVQRQVRTAGGRRRVREADYLPGGRKQHIGSRFSVASLIGDSVRRVFTSTAELERYANGRTDYIGDVVTGAAGTFWYRLPRNRLTVLGESHNNPDGNVEDVILGLNTSRFMYEPFNEFSEVAPFRQSRIGTGTQARLAQIHSGAGGSIRTGHLVNRRRYNPDLENIIIKALAGASIARNEYIAANPSGMSAAQQTQWRRRASTNDYSYGERAALYLSLAIHIAQDIAQFNFRPPGRADTAYLTAGRALTAYYTANQAVLDRFMTAKDGDDLIGIYELTAPGGFSNLNTIRDFTVVFHEFAARYIEQLGRQIGNRALRNEGTALVTNTGATLNTLSPAREEIMWRRVRQARVRGYLLVGMGDAHRRNLLPRLTAAGIPHEEVEASLLAQQATINANWVP